MEEMCKFNLSDEQIEYIQRFYADELIVQNVFKCRYGNEFIVSVDNKIDFMDFIEDMYAIDGVDKHGEPTSDGYMLEEIRDSIYAQTN